MYSQFICSLLPARKHQNPSRYYDVLDEPSILHVYVALCATMSTAVDNDLRRSAWACEASMSLVPTLGALQSA